MLFGAAFIIINLLQYTGPFIPNTDRIDLSKNDAKAYAGYSDLYEEGADISSQLRSDLQKLQYAGGSRKLDLSRLSTAVISSPVTVPSYVEIDCGKHYEGGDGFPMTTLRFVNASSKFILADKSAIHGCNLVSDVADHLIEISGQVGIDHVRISTRHNGILMSKDVKVGKSLLINVGMRALVTVGNGVGGGGADGSTLIDGVYGKVPIQAGDGKGDGASVKIKIVNHVISTATFDADGNGYSPSFSVNLKAGALYIGSPKLQNFGLALVNNSGRSHIENLFISTTAQSGTTCLQIDGGLDFIFLSDNECWNATGKISPKSTGLAFGQGDGLNVKTFAVFGFDIGMLGEAPKTGYRDFQTFTDIHCDGSNACYDNRQPEDNLVIIGGYFRSIGTDILIDNTVTNFTLNGSSQTAQASVATMVLSANSGSIVGNNFNRQNSNDKPFIAIGPPQPTGAEENIEIGNNSFDNHGPGIFLNRYSENAHISQNAWPWNGKFAYYIDGGARNVTVMPTHSGQISITANDDGVASIPHALGFKPIAPDVRVVGSQATETQAVLIGSDSRNLYVKFVQRRDGRATGVRTFLVAWTA